jgi:F-type H+-transporting ATPase subunit epsilon
MRLKLISTSATVFDGEIDMVVLPGSDGEIGIMQNHMDMISGLKSGELRIYREDKIEKHEIKGGIVSVYEGFFVDVMLE